ncbi:uncharacterized protein L203_102269 [Cryptococcus depauperatus CBS 7841]|uniref:Uncharacterized protein n=1 Tax=Cryptococcus depauperatus CBS 7841 TaxID=1295531 RepID=A0A1E3IS04_9TREE|nr:cytoplasmic protein [Cryptococcus depauperatus CBS 7841]
MESTNETRDYGNFKLLKTFFIKHTSISIAKWRSERTGLTVVLSSHQAPITNGYFVVASEIFDDSGRPRILKHLVFLGSKRYPYKGVLDQLANRAGSNGTSAYTDVDHTVYTISTAGSEGFLRMIPIYVDHILHPTITDAGFVTEVYHINDAGEDAGVVYSKTQAREKDMFDLMALEGERTLYPPTSAYRSETNGLLHKLQALTVQEVRDYHAKYYKPYNLCLVIDGAMPIPALFKILNDEVDPMILAQNCSQPICPPDWKRPFVESSSALPLSIPKSITKVVEFMEDDESVGELAINFLGPAHTDHLTKLALNMLNNYLNEYATSPLSKEFIDIPKPLCTAISMYISDRLNSSKITIYMIGVPVRHLEDIEGLLKAKLKNIVEKESINMDLMQRILKMEQRSLLEDMENNVSSVLSEAIIGDFLYGDKDGADLPMAFNDFEHYATLRAYSADQWTALLDEYFVSSSSVTIIGRPSTALSEKIEKEENERIAKRKEDLGEEKLRQLGQKLEKAKKESEIPPPKDMITEFPVANPNKLIWIPVETAVNKAKNDITESDTGHVQEYIDSDASTLPYQVHFSHVKSNFVAVTVLIDTFDVPAHLKPYLTLFQNSLFSTKVKRADGTILSHKEVVDQLQDLTVAQSAHFEYEYNFADILVVTLEASKDQYEEIVPWMRDLITGGVFDKDGLVAIVAKLVQKLSDEKVEGDTIATAWAKHLAYDSQKSSSQACGILNRLTFIPQLKEMLENNFEEVIKRMEELRQHLLNFSKTRISVQGNILSLREPRSVLARSFIRVPEARPLDPLSTSRQTLTELGKNPAKKCIVTPMSTIEGSYATFLAVGPVGCSHPDFPALELTATVLNALESHAWESIRGLACKVQFLLYPEAGLVGFNVHESPNAVLAYEAAGKVMRGLVDGSVELSQNLVDGAKSTMTYSYVRKLDTLLDAAANSFLNEVLKGLGKNADQELLKQIPDITLQQVRYIIAKYFSPLFEAKSSIGALSVPRSKLVEVERGLGKLGFETERKDLPVLKGDCDSQDGDDV